MCKHKWKMVITFCMVTSQRTESIRNQDSYFVMSKDRNTAQRLDDYGHEKFDKL